MPQVSIIVPVYNIESYIKKCIDSILRQNFSNFELLLIDDGSTDSSGEICDYYSTLDSRIIVKHIFNSGVSYARNIGLEMAQGQYITFIDGDDWVDSDYLDVMIKSFSNSCDVVICGGREVTETGSTIRRCLFERNETLAWNDNRLYDWPYFTYVIHRLLVPATLGKSITFDTDLSNGEDSLYLTKVFLKAKQGVFFLTDVKYNYLIRENSLVQHKKYSTSKFSSVFSYERRLMAMENAGIKDMNEWYKSFLLELYRIYNYIVWNTEYYSDDHANTLFSLIKKYRKYSSVLGSGIKFKMLFGLSLLNKSIMEKQLKEFKLPLPHIMER